MSNVSKPHEQLAAVSGAESRDSRIARRNMQLGVWAGAQLKLSQERCAAYALAVMVAGIVDSGHNHVVDKITRDFAKNGVPISRGQIRHQLGKHCRPH
jgi:hypothetical protein